MIKKHKFEEMPEVNREFLIFFENSPTMAGNILKDDGYCEIWGFGRCNWESLERKENKVLFWVYENEVIENSFWS